MTIFDHIQYLITRHDCVVVSGLGAFVAQSVPAQVSADGLMLLPPSRMLVFNNVISHDDGMLAGSMARREGVSYEEAREELSRQVELIRRRIDADGFVDIPRVGRLSATEGAALIFTPVASDAIVDMGFSALPTVRIAGEAETSAPHIMEMDVETPGHSIARRLRSAARYAAIVALLFAAGITLTTPVMVDDRNVAEASLSMPAITPARKVVVPAVPVTPAQETAADNTVRQTIPVAMPPAVVRVSELTGADAENRYSCFVIVASCTTESEARRFIRQKDSDSLGVLHSDGRYRVYAALSNDYDAAFRFKSTDRDFMASYPNAWVYKKQ